MWCNARFHTGACALFTVINGVSSVSQTIFPVIFADVSNVFIAGNNMMSCFQLWIMSLRSWMQVNICQLATCSSQHRKTQSKIFSKEHTPSSANVIINNGRIKRVPAVKFLGVRLDERLRWIDQVSWVLKLLKTMESWAVLTKLSSLSLLDFILSSILIYHTVLKHGEQPARFI